jgi:hypothetical protein
LKLVLWILSSSLSFVIALHKAHYPIYVADMGKCLRKISIGLMPVHIILFSKEAKMIHVTFYLMEHKTFLTLTSPFISSTSLYSSYFSSSPSSLPFKGMSIKSVRCTIPFLVLNFVLRIFVQAIYSEIESHGFKGIRANRSPFLSSSKLSKTPGESI